MGSCLKIGERASSERAIVDLFVCQERGGRRLMARAISHMMGVNKEKDGGAFGICGQGTPSVSR